MTTVRDIVARAFRKLSVTAFDTDPTADEMAEGVEAYNMMLHSWKLRKVDIEHVDQVEADTFPLGPEFEEGTVYNLAARLGPNYTAPATFNSEMWFRTMQAALRPKSVATYPNGLLNLPSQKKRVY
jgi:hypothetical protein